MRTNGFTLVEVLVAMAMLAGGGLAVAQLVATAIAQTSLARSHTIAAMLASAKLEQLRGLQLEFDDSGARLTDTTTSLASDPAAGGGSGLGGAPGIDPLTENAAGFFDYLDARGRWLASGATMPAGATFVRRWAIEYPGQGSDLVVLQVLVRPVSRDGGGVGRRTPGEARFVTARARTHR